MWQLNHKESWAPKNWCFWTVVLEKALQSPMDSQEIKPVIPKGNQPWIFIGRTDAETETPKFWLLDAKSRFIRKDPDAGTDWRQEKGMTEDEMVGWHYWLNGHGSGRWWRMEAWCAAAYEVAKSQTQLSDWTIIIYICICMYIHTYIHTCNEYMYSVSLAILLFLDI